MSNQNKPAYTGRQQTIETNTIRTREIIGKALDDMIRANAAEKIPLSDLPRVKQAAQQYLSECADGAMMPTVRGMAARLGLSRNAVYDYQKNHPGSEFSEWLEDFSDMCGEIMMAAALDKSVDTVSAIFTAKARHGWRDSIVIETKATNPLGPELPVEEIAEKYAFLPDE